MREGGDARDTQTQSEYNIFFLYEDLTVVFDPTTYTVNEGEQVSIGVVLSTSADRDVTVTFTTNDGSATGKVSIS